MSNNKVNIFCRRISVIVLSVLLGVAATAQADELLHTERLNHLDRLASSADANLETLGLPRFGELAQLTLNLPLRLALQLSEASLPDRDGGTRQVIARFSRLNGLNLLEATDLTSGQGLPAEAFLSVKGDLLTPELGRLASILRLAGPDGMELCLNGLLDSAPQLLESSSQLHGSGTASATAPLSQRAPFGLHQSPQLTLGLELPEATLSTFNRRIALSRTDTLEARVRLEDPSATLEESCLIEPNLRCEERPSLLQGLGANSAALGAVSLGLSDTERVSLLSA